LPVAKERPYLPLDHQSIGQVSQQAQREFVLHGVADDGPVSFFPDTVAMAKIPKRTAPLLVAEELIPAEFRNTRIPRQPQRDQGSGRKLMVMTDPSPAAALAPEAIGGATRSSLSTLARCQPGMSGGRLAGSAKKANTFSLG
jgi:hypothetical protein